MRPLTDAAVARRDPDELMRELDGLCRAIASSYFLPGGEADDLIQEARLGLAKAIADFRGRGASHFVGFAQLCIRRQVITAVKHATRGLHRPLNERWSMEAPIRSREIGDDFHVGDLFAAPDSDPCDIVIAREETELLLRRITLLTPLERECVERVTIRGESYEDVGPHKSVDNAVQRARVKLAREPRHRRERAAVVVLVDRALHPTRRGAIRAALAVRFGHVVSVEPWKLLDGRLKDGRGRPDKSGRTGQAVWRVELAAVAERLAA